MYAADASSPSSPTSSRSYKPTINPYAAPQSGSRQASRNSIFNTSEDVNEPYTDAASPSERSSHLSRAKSISSVSSVTSTSSMEAAPFRAAPLGNIRMGYIRPPGGSAVGEGTGHGKGIAALGRVPATSGRAEVADFLNAAEAAAREATVSPVQYGQSSSKSGQADRPTSLSLADVVSGIAPLLPLDSTTTPKATRKQGHIPKAPSDLWLYRNAPGMGSHAGGKPIPGTNLRHSHNSADLAPLIQYVSSNSGTSSPTSTTSAVPASTSRRPATVALRQKLAKSASKLGLKPLTIIPGSTLPRSSTAAELGNGNSASTTTEDLSLQQDLISSATGAAVMDPRNFTPGTGGAGKGGDKTIRLAGIRASSPMLAGSDQFAIKTSALTNAPLEAPKLSPLPELASLMLASARAGDDTQAAGITMTSPGGGRFSPTFSRNSYSPLLTPTRPSFGASVSGTPPPLTSSWGSQPVGSMSPGSSNSRPASRTSNRRPSFAARRKSSYGKLAPQQTDGVEADLKTNKHATVSPPLTPALPVASSMGFSWSASGPQDASSPTPAEVVIMEAKAGVAKLPTEGSGPMPGPTPVAEVRTQDSNAYSEPEEDGELPRKDSGDEGGSRAGQKGLKESGTSSVEAVTSLPSSGEPPAPSQVETRQQAPPVARALAPPMLRFESAATAISKAVSDTSDTAAMAVPIRDPGRQVAGKGPESKMTYEGIGVKTTGQNQADGSSPTNELLTVPSGRDRGNTHLSAISEASPSATSTMSMAKDGNADSSAKQPLPTAAPTATAATRSNPSSRPRGRDDFEFGDILGEGSYSTVMLAWDLLSNPHTSRPAKPTTSPATAMSGSGSLAPPEVRETKRAYAIKTLDKVHILKERKQKYVAVEKQALSLLIGVPGVITLYWTFQDAESLYFVLELAPNGELLTLIKRYGSFDDATTKFYAAQLLDAISEMHKAGVIHRDIKPENVLLDAEMRVKVADFGSAKITQVGAEEAEPTSKAPERERASSFVGTAEYISPELLTDKAAGKPCDFWAFGCVVYQMLVGRPPFKATSEYQTFQKIIKGEYHVPSELGAEAQDLIRRLLVLDPATRLGSSASGADDIKQHPFFDGFDWATLWTRPVLAMGTGIVQPVEKAEPSQDASFGDLFGCQGWVNEGDEMDEDDPLNPNPPIRPNLNDSLDGGEYSGVSPSDEASREWNAPDPKSPSLQSGHNADDDGGDNSDDVSSQSDSIGDRDLEGSRQAYAATSQNVPPATFNGTPRGRSSLGQFAGNIFRTTSRGSEDGSPLHGSPRMANRRLSSSLASVQNRSSINNLPIAPSLERPSPTQMGFSPSLDTTALDNEAVLSGSVSMLNWSALLLPSETILLLSPVVHRKPTMNPFTSSQARKRVLILTDFPRIMAVKVGEAKLTVKSEVLITGGGTSQPPQQRTGVSARRDSVPAYMHSQQRRGSSVGGAPSSSANDSRRPSSASFSTTDGSPNRLLSIDVKSAKTFAIQTPLQSYLYEDASPAAAAGEVVASWVSRVRRLQEGP